MKQPTFRKQWLVVWLLVLSGVVWTAAGRSWARRHVFNPAPIPESARVEKRFLALWFPNISRNARKYAMSRAELSDLLSALRGKGYTSIGLEDVREFYANGRGLPPKAVLLVFPGDDPGSIMLADRVLKSQRMRANAFLTRTARAGGSERRLYLTRHAVAEMLAGGAWQFGWISQPEPEAVPELAGLSAVLDDGTGRALPTRGAYPLRFTVSDLGLNDASDSPQALHVMPVRPEHLRELNERIIDNSWPRRSDLADDFSNRDLDPDWIPGWGVIAKGDGRLMLLPLPRQTGAGLFLRGTDKWRDSVLEFDLQRQKKEFWAYARYRGEDGFIRVGVRNGWWYAEQKLGPHNLPTMLARAPLVDDGRAARVRFVLKDGAAIVHVNGRMMFGRPLRVSPRVTRGRVMFGVYDAKTRSALAVLSRVRARPLPESWIAFPDGGTRVGSDETRLYALREDAVFARALSPRWLSLGADGSVLVARQQETLIRSLAGFYGCRLAPMADFTEREVAVLSNPAAAARMLGGLDAAARELDASGVNLRVRAADLRRPEMIRFLAKLRAGLHGARRQLWITTDGPVPPDAESFLAVDGVLRRSPDERGGYELLEESPAPPVKPAFKEFASIP